MYSVTASLSIDGICLCMMCSGTVAMNERPNAAAHKAQVVRLLHPESRLSARRLFLGPKTIGQGRIPA